MPFSQQGLRALMSQVRALMSIDLPPDARLQQITNAIADGLRCEVCSIYVARGQALEMVANHGLCIDASVPVALGLTEGLVGSIARTVAPVNLKDAQKSELFSLVPQLREEPFHGFLGVPIVYSGNCVGVLVVQQCDIRSFSTEETEALQTVATVLAQWLSLEKLLNVSPVGEADPGHTLPLRRAGMSIAEGAVVGTVVLHRPRITPSATIADDSATELEKLEHALTALRSEVDDMLIHPAILRDDEHREMIEAFRMFANDRGWVRNIKAGIEAGLTAEAAVTSAGGVTMARMRKLSDPILRERMHDLDELDQRLLHHLQGRSVSVARGLRPGSVLVARSLGPASLLDYDRKNLVGLVLAEGGRGSHIALLARSFGIPAVSDAEQIVEAAENGDVVVVNGGAGLVYLRPPGDVVNAYNERIRYLAGSREELRKKRHMEAVTADGFPIDIKLNCGLLVDVEGFEDTGAKTVGLFRTELLFLAVSHLPTVREQRQAYCAVLGAVSGRAVHFRTVDVGGDKVLPYLRPVDQPNPAIGWRALRLSLDRPGLLRHQLRALLQAADGRELSIMFPMVSEPGEFIAAKKMLDIEKQRHERMGGRTPKSLLVGAMIEVPSMVWYLDELLPLVDFVSVGTNDLFQFMFAVDRDNIKVHNRYDPISIAGLRILQRIVEQCHIHNVPVDLCGDMASEPVAAMALLGLGYTSLSMPARSVGPIKQVICAARMEDLRRMVHSALEDPFVDLRSLIEAYARQRGIAVCEDGVEDMIEQAG